MDEEMIMLDNIMPLELAIKRELEYRRKMEASQKQHKSKYKQFLVPTQGPLPSQVGIKRKGPAINIQKHPASLVCKACQLAFTTMFHLKQHCASQTHKDNLLQLKARGGALSNPLSCELCQASCSSERVMEQHLNGTKHVASLQEVEKGKRATGEASAGDALVNKRSRT
uniref:Putative Zinc finger, C2H2 n=1 Tax=Davidia involucrata TaxID=16924 RepID=A0A5B7AQW1_DAVIN